MHLLIQKRNQYEHAFRLLVSDFVRICEFIEPSDEHLATYSHRLYELLLRACTEFESLCSEALAAEGYKKKGNLNITDYVRVEPKLSLRKQIAIVTLWRPHPLELKPFANWTVKSSALSWYRGYNAVKHNRNMEFSHANLRNVRDALTSLFIVLARLRIVENDGSHLDVPGGSWQGVFKYDGLPFALRYEVVLGEPEAA